MKKQKRKVAKRNPVARVLKDPRYRKRVVKLKTAYDRKKKGELIAPLFDIC